MRVLYAGTPETAVPVLEALVASRHDVVGVLTRPDAPFGRKRVLTPSPVAAAAAAHGIPVIKADRLRGEAGADAAARVRELDADLAVVVAYGALVPADLLSVPTHGWLNLHFSTLPAWRGAAPVQRAMMAGQTRIGADVFQLEEGLDTGPVFARTHRDVRPGQTAGDVLGLLAEDGGPLVLDVLDGLAAGTAHATPQQGEPTHAAKLTHADGLVDPDGDAPAVAALVNGVTPEPGAWGWMLQDDADAPTRFKLDAVLPRPESDLPETVAAAKPGRLLTAAEQAWLRTAGGALELTRVQPAGKRLMPAADWARGATGTPRLLSGDRLAAHTAELQAAHAARLAARTSAEGSTRA
ncbi:methionyl-tRNA formyltransferase [Micrococcus luteus]